MGQDAPKEAGKSSIIVRNLRLMGHRKKKINVITGWRCNLHQQAKHDALIETLNV